MSNKRYFEAYYRIFSEEDFLEYNNGYICINEDSSIVGVFTLDIAYINFCDDTIIMSLYIKDIDDDNKPIDFIGKCCGHFMPMTHHILVSDEIYLYLRIGEEISNPKACVKELFKNLT